MPNEGLLELAIQVPHLDGLIRGTTHEEVLLLRKTKLEHWAGVSLH